MGKEKYVWGLLRIAIGWIFIWAFFDKLLGFGFSTASGKAWINGISPTYGFLKAGTHGPLATFYQSIAGVSAIDWLFMLGLLFVGATLLFGIMTRAGSVAGIAMLFLMYSALILPTTNPILDEHLIYILILIGVIMTEAGEYIGFGKWWANTSLVKKYRFFR